MFLPPAKIQLLPPPKKISKPPPSANLERFSVKLERFKSQKLAKLNVLERFSFSKNKQKIPLE